MSLWNRTKWFVYNPDQTPIMMRACLSLFRSKVMAGSGSQPPLLNLFRIPPLHPLFLHIHFLLCPRSSCIGDPVWRNTSDGSGWAWLVCLHWRSTVPLFVKKVHLHATNKGSIKQLDEYLTVLTLWHDQWRTRCKTLNRVTKKKRKKKKMKHYYFSSVVNQLLSECFCGFRVKLRNRHQHGSLPVWKY